MRKWRLWLYFLKQPGEPYNQKVVIVLTFFFYSSPQGVQQWPRPLRLALYRCLHHTTSISQPPLLAATLESLQRHKLCPDWKVRNEVEYSVTKSLMLQAESTRDWLAYHACRFFFPLSGSRVSFKLQRVHSIRVKRCCVSGTFPPFPPPPLLTAWL